MSGLIRIALLAVTLPAATLFAVHHVAGAATRIELTATARGNTVDPGAAVLILSARVVDRAESPVARGSVRFRMNGAEIGASSVDRSGVAMIRVTTQRDLSPTATYLFEAVYGDDMYEPSRAVVTYSGRLGALSATVRSP